MSESSSTPSSPPHKKRQVSKDDLPPPLWAKVLDFLDFTDVQLFYQVQQASFRDAVAPHVQVLTLTDYRQLSKSTAQQHSNVQKLFILCYAKPDRCPLMDVCQATHARFIAFCAQFQQLTYVYLGTRERGSLAIYRPILPWCNPSRIHHLSDALHRRLVISYCAAVDTGHISGKVVMEGLRIKCDYFWRDAQNKCILCPLFNQRLPLDQLYSYDLVLTCGVGCTKKEELFQTMLGRQGGSDYLRESQRFILSIQRQWRDGSGRIISYTTRGLDTMKQLIAHGCDPSKVNRVQLFNALWGKPNGTLPPSLERLITEAAFRKLVELKFPICMEDCAAIPFYLYGNPTPRRPNESRDTASSSAGKKEEN